MAQSRFQTRLREDVQASNILYVETQDDMSLRDVGRPLADRLGVPQKAVDDEKTPLASLASQAIEEHSGAKLQALDNVTQLAGSPCVPPEIWTVIVQKLDLSSSIAAMQVCKMFYQTISSCHSYWDPLVGDLMTARFLVPKGYFTKSTFTTFHKLVHDLMLCRDCGAFADWPAGQKICKQCCQGYDAMREGQRYMTKDSAKFVYKLRDSDLVNLRHMRAQNPIYPQFAPMQLYEKVSVRRAAIERWGSIEGMLQSVRPMKELSPARADGLPNWAASQQSR